MVGRTQPRVLDFGIARVAHQQESNDPHSGAGSPYYMAPEQVRRELSDRRADVFSLGVVLYELLTDVKPFRGESLTQIREAVLHHEPPLANKIDPAVPKALAAIAARAMAKDPEQRFRSARSFARELRQWLDENPVNGDGEKTAPAEALPARTSGVMLGAVIAAGIAAVTAAVATWVVLVPATPALADSTATQLEARATMGAIDPDRQLSLSRAEVASTATTPGVTTAPPAAPAVDLAPTTTSAVNAAPTSSVESAAPTPSTLAAPLPTPAATAAVAPPTTAAAVKPAGTPPLPAPATPPRESAKDKKARESREREARESDARVAAAARLVAPATGTVKIAISPWGLVEVDGASSGAAPPITELTLSEGRHQIVVRNGDYAPHTVSVNVTAGQTISVRHKFGS